MRERIGPLLVAGLVGGLVGGGTVWATTGGEPNARASAERRSSPDEKPASTESDDDPEAEDDGDRVKALERRVALLERRSSAATELRKYATSLAKDRGDGGDDNSLAPVMDSEDPVFEMAVRGVLDKYENEQREERRVRREQRQQERNQRQVDYLEEKLDLTAAQKQRVSDLLEKRAKRFRELRDADGDGGVQRPRNRQEWRQRIGTIRDDTERGLLDILDESQKSTYNQLVEDEGSPLTGGWGRRGGGRRGR